MGGLALERTTIVVKELYPMSIIAILSTKVFTAHQPFFLEYIIPADKIATRRMRYANMPELNGIPIEFTKTLSKSPASLITPCISPIWINPNKAIETTPVITRPLILNSCFLKKYTRAIAGIASRLRR